MRSALTERLRRMYWFGLQLGFDPRRTMRALYGLPRYFVDLVRFWRAQQGKVTLMPSLHDRFEPAGVMTEYFWQDLYVARQVYRRAPTKHVDVGSRIDGFVAHVASFREIEVLDIRPLPMCIEGVHFRQADIMSDRGLETGYCDSLSCLHALEHFGLGRYGDSLDAVGHERALRQLARLLRRGGILYLAVPVGQERVEFNSHRVLDPEKLVALATDASLVLEELVWVRPDRGVLEIAGDVGTALKELAAVRYALAIFCMRRK